MAGPSVDVVVPVRRPATVQRLVAALARGTEPPDVVTLVGHEVPRGLDPHGLAVRVLRPGGTHYAVGDRDVVLRRNAGAFASTADALVFLDDDVVPARSTIAGCRTLLGRSPVLWGHYRYRSLADVDLETLLDLPPTAGRSREHGVNRWHGWMSCYGGMAAFTRETFTAAGGYDMAYAGRHAGEDQDLGRRLSRQLGHGGQAFVHEPPFVWHDEAVEPWAPPAWTNLCAGPHDCTQVVHGGVPFLECTRCPWREPVGDLPQDTEGPVLAFDPDLVETSVFAL